MVKVKLTKSILNKIGGVIARIAFLAAVISMSTACLLIFHQPKVPEGLEKFKKF